LVQDPLAEGVYAAADIVCQLSQWEEAFGFTIAEAMSAGKPLIASRVGGIPELVSDGVSGYLVNRNDVATTAERILLLATDSARRIMMGQNGRHACEERFDVRKNVAQLVELYALSENSRGKDIHYKPPKKLDFKIH
jgi:glycosyltransferase involved in cell wall biosynthesis